MARPTLTGFVGRASAAIDEAQRRKDALAQIISRGNQAPVISFQRPRPSVSKSILPKADASITPASEFSTAGISGEELSTGDRYKSTLTAIDKLAQSAMKEGDNYTISRLSVLREKVNKSIKNDIDHDYMPEVWETGAIHSKNVKAFALEEGLGGIDELTEPEFDETYLKTRPYNVDGNPVTYAQITKVFDKTEGNLRIMQGLEKLTPGVMYPLNPNIQSHQRLIAERMDSGMKEEKALLATSDDMIRAEFGTEARFNNELNMAYDRRNQLKAELDRDDDVDMFGSIGLEATHEKSKWVKALRDEDARAISLAMEAIDGDPAAVEAFEELGFTLDELSEFVESKEEEE